MSEKAQVIAHHILRNKVLLLAFLAAVLEAVANGASVLTATIVVVGLLQRQLAVPADEVVTVQVDPRTLVNQLNAVTTKDEGNGNYL